MMKIMGQKERQVFILLFVYKYDCGCFYPYVFVCVFYCMLCAVLVLILHMFVLLLSRLFM